MGYAAKRAGGSLLVLFAASVVIFSLLHLATGSPATVIAGPDATASEVHQVARAMGLDKPLPQQYWSWLTGLLSGRAGYSYILRQPITTLIAQRIGSTVQLMIAVTLVMSVLGLVLGVLSAGSRNRIVREVVEGISALALAMPPFVGAIILIFVFAIELRVLPAGGQSGFFSGPSVSIQYLILPGVAGALPAAASLGRLLSAEMQRVEREAFTRTATAKGASRWRVLLIHVLPNSIGPALVETGIRVGELFAGAVVIESLFARSGIGSLLVNAVQQRDYLLAEDLLMMSVAFAIVMQFLTEMAMARVDQRVQFQALS